MPTFSALALDRYLDQGVSKTAADSNLDRINSTPPRARLAANPNLKPPLQNGALENKAQCRQISPALYVTPASTPLPDSPTSISPSPYVINHKRRGPRLQKSSSEANVVKEKMVDDKILSSNHLSFTEAETRPSSAAAFADSSSVQMGEVNGFHEDEICDPVDVTGVNSVERESDYEDFFDPQESLSIAGSTDGEYFTADQSSRTFPSVGSFYDACEELSSDSGHQPRSSVNDLEAEFRGMRLSLLMEIEKRKQAEDSLCNIQRQWQYLREKLRELGLVLPADPTTVQDAQLNVDSIDDICQQIYITRLVSESIASEAARAECEEEMDAQLEVKNFEITRLCDRLKYYETVNQEMCQRNQESIELARRDRQRRRRIQNWFWGSVVTAIAVGGAALAWSYIPIGKESSLALPPQTPEPNTTTD